MIMTFQQSVVLCLLKGTKKGIQSLLEESLTITREMLREAQLAYPRNPVRDHNLTLICCREIFILIIASPKFVMVILNLMLEVYFFNQLYVNIHLKRGIIIDNPFHCVQVLQSLKSKMLDLARALQNYMYCHITVSLNGTIVKIERLENMLCKAFLVM